MHISVPQEDGSGWGGEGDDEKGPSVPGDADLCPDPSARTSSATIPNGHVSSGLQRAAKCPGHLGPRCGGRSAS